jgi:hypothetical protein
VASAATAGTWRAMGWAQLRKMFLFILLCWYNSLAVSSLHQPKCCGTGDGGSAGEQGKLVARLAMGTLAAGYVQFANQRAGSHPASQWHDAWTCKCKCRPVPLGPLRRPQAASCIWRHRSPPDPAAAASAATCSFSAIMATAGPQVVPQKGFRVVAGVLLVLMLLEALGQIDLRLQFNVRGVATAAGDRDRFRARPLGWTLPNGGFRCVVQAMKMSKGGTAPRIDFAGASGNSSGSGGGGGEVAAEAAAGGACPPAPECPAADCHCEDCSADGVAAQKAAKAGDAMPSAEGGSSGGSGGGGGTALPAWQTSHQPALPARQMAKGIVSQGATGRARRAMGKLLRGEPISLAFVGGSITWCACMWAVLCEQRNVQPPLLAVGLLQAMWLAPAVFMVGCVRPPACMPECCRLQLNRPPLPRLPHTADCCRGQGADQVGKTDYAALVLDWINATFPHPGHHLSNGGIPAAPSRCVGLLLASRLIRISAGV